jgi:MFS-type transporter involved in bile tolerance (Atg22 family)
MLQKPSLVLLMLTTLSSLPITFSTLTFLTQFVSKRYNIKIADTGYIQSAFGVAHIIVVAAIVPYISHLVMKPTTIRAIRISDDKQRDLVFAMWSYGATAVGAIIMAVSPALSGFVGGIMVLALGSGAGSLIRSTMALYVDAEHRTRMFSLVGIIEVAGSLYAMPALAGLFTLGMRLGGEWIGLPYVGITVLCVIVVVLLQFVRLPSTRGDDDDDAQSFHSGSDTANEEDGF